MVQIYLVVTFAVSQSWSHSETAVETFCHQ
jgi:hypothetical protein